MRRLRSTVSLPAKATFLASAAAGGNPARRRVCVPRHRRRRAGDRQASVDLPTGAGEPAIVASLQRHVGVPGLSAPDNPVYGGSAAHAPNEHIRVEDFAPAIEFTIAVLEELGR